MYRHVLFRLELRDSRLTHRKSASGELQPRLLNPGSGISNGTTPRYNLSLLFLALPLAGLEAVELGTVNNGLKRLKRLMTALG